MMSRYQKEELYQLFLSCKHVGEIDYVSGWYMKAAKLINCTQIKCAFVSTNSITQGEQVAAIWQPIFENFNVHIDFAHRTFRWDSEANIKAHVHCVIIGFSTADNAKPKMIFDSQTSPTGLTCRTINAYLIDAPNVFIESRNKPLCKIPAIRKGNQPTDGGNLIIEAQDLDEFQQQEPSAMRFVKRLKGAREFINNLPRYCLWLVGVSPAELRKMPFVMKRIEAVRAMRLASTDKAVREKHSLTPHLFREQNNYDSFIIVPSVSSERRAYIPLGFEGKDTIPTNLVLIIPDATLYHFGILTSSVHMAWMRVVAGRLKSDYRYSVNIVYNNFPWPSSDRADWSDLSDKISQTAQAILDARALYPDCSLADLYDEATMPPELRKAHQTNDRAVMKAYGYAHTMTEPEIVADLMKRYQELTK